MITYGRFWVFTEAGRRKRRDYTTLMIAPSAAARVYAKHTNQEYIH